MRLAKGRQIELPILLVSIKFPTDITRKTWAILQQVLRVQVRLLTNRQESNESVFGETTGSLAPAGLLRAQALDITGASWMMYYLLSCALTLDSSTPGRPQTQWI